MPSDLRAVRPADLDTRVQIVRELPAFFTEDVSDRVRRDLEHDRGRVALEAGEVVGFLAVDGRSDQAAGSSGWP